MNLQLTFLIISFVLTVTLAPMVIGVLKKRKIGQVVRDIGIASQSHKEGTLTMGGIIMLIVIVLVLIISSFTYSILLLPLISTLGFGLVGLMDDLKKIKEHNTQGISPKKKMLLLFLVTIIFIVLYLFVFNLGKETLIPFISNPVYLTTGFFIIVTGFILLGTSNAINLTDGLDGLATGIVAIIMTFFTLMAIKTNNVPMIIFGSTVIGTCIGFLIFNIKPAKVFMGDTGSLALGGAIAAIAIIMKMPIYLAIVALIPVIETITSALQIIYFKRTGGKRLFKMAPFHHHLELSGISETKIVLLFWFISVVVCVIAYFV